MGITKSAYAKRRGVSPAAVTKALKTGRIKELPDGTIDPDEADAMWEANSKTSVATPQTSAARPKTQAATDARQADYHEERALHEAAKRELAELRLAEERGELVRRASLRRAIFDAAREVRNRLLSIPARVAPLVAGESDIVACQKLIGDEIQEALEDLVPAELRAE